MDATELEAIKRRDKNEHGSWHSDGGGAPVVHLSFGERLINIIPHKTDLYMRQKRNETTAENSARWYATARTINEALAPAYQAIADRHALLAEIERLRGELAVLRYDVLADGFYDETGMWPPGRSRPAAMGGCPEGDDERIAAWMAWCKDRGAEICEEIGDRADTMRRFVSAEERCRDYEDSNDRMQGEIGRLCDRVSSALAWANDVAIKDVPPQYDTYREGVRTAKHQALQLLQNETNCSHSRWAPTTNGCPDCGASERL